MAIYFNLLILFYFLAFGKTTDWIHDSWFLIPDHDRPISYELVNKLGQSRWLS